ncbi:MAG: immunoglobulin domain-containing protein [Verrucomicrobiota bacterium]
MCRRVVVQVVVWFVGALVAMPVVVRLPAAELPLPVILQHPTSQVVPLDTPLSLSVNATGDGQIEYQWRRNGVNIANATAATFTIERFTAAEAGQYDVIVRTAAGARLSEPAVVRAVLEPIPFTDAFDARVIPVVPSAVSGEGQGSNTGATIERNEPEHAGKPGGRSVWYAWRAPAGGIVTFDTMGSDFDTLLAVYSGNVLPALNASLVASDDDSGGFHTSKVAFNVEAGAVYSIAIDGLNGAAGNIVLRWQLEIIPDLLDRLPIFTRRPASLVALPGSPVSLDADFTGAAAQVRWTFKDQPLPEISRTLNLGNVNRDQVGRYAVEIFNGLRSIRTEPVDVQINLKDGITLRSILALNKFPEAFRAARPRAIVLQNRLPRRRAAGGTSRGYTGTQIFNTYGATTDAGEPLICDIGGGASEWYSYEAEANGTLKIDTDGSDFDTVLGVYVDNGTGSGFYDSLQEVACDNNSGLDGRDSAVSFPATKGAIYYIAVDGVNGASGTVELHYYLGDPPTFTTPPANQSVAAGNSAQFSVVATGMEPLFYQWRFGRLNLDGATNATLTLTNVQPDQAGDYSAVVWNAVGTNTTPTATLVIKTPPTNLPIPDQSIAEDSGPIAIPFTVSDSDTPLDSLTISATSQNLVLIPQENVTLSGSGANRTLTLTSAAHAAGEATIILSVADDSVTVTQTVRIFVSAVNDAPSATPASLNAIEDGGPVSLSLTGSDVEGSALTYTIVSPPAKGTLDGTPPNLTYSAFPNAHGPDAFSFKVSDGELESTPATVAVEIAPVNDPPSVSTPSDLALYLGQSSAPLAIQLSDIETPAEMLNFTVELEEPSVLTPSHLTVAGSGSNRTLIVNAPADRIGVAQVILTVSDSDGGIVSTRFAVTVTSRRVRALPVTAVWGGRAELPVHFESEGNETGLQFSIAYDPMRLLSPTVRVGSSALEAVMTLDTAQADAGRIGIQLTLPEGRAFEKGTNELVLIDFAVASNAGGASTLIEFIDEPTARNAASTNQTVLPLFSESALVMLLQGFEGDTTPRPDGNANGSVTIADWVQVGRFATGLDEIASPGEFMRADCAPRLENGNLVLGNGALSILDWVQAGRYAAGLDPIEAAAGPVAAALSIGDQASKFLLASSSPREIELVADRLVSGAISRLNLEIEASGDENAVGFSLEFEPTLLRFETARLHVPGATLHINRSRATTGRVGFGLALPPGAAFQTGRIQLLEVEFGVIASTSLPTRIVMANAPVRCEVASVHATSLPAAFRDLPLSLASLRIRRTESQPSEGHLRFTIASPESGGFIIETSHDLIHWQALSEGFLNGVMTVDPFASRYPAQFFRVRSNP